MYISRKDKRKYKFVTTSKCFENAMVQIKDEITDKIYGSICTLSGML